MFWNTTKIFESLATITANTKNHNAELQEFKGTFQRHIEKEEKEEGEINKKFEALQKCLSDKECPRFGDFKKIERRFESRRISDKDEAAKEKTLEVKERGKKDEEIAKEISSLRTSRKYQWMTSSGIYIILGVILKKVFSH